MEGLCFLDTIRSPKLPSTKEKCQTHMFNITAGLTSIPVLSVIP